MNAMIQNPILPGFNPDPSICRVGDDFYIATSTFEWYPGVQIHHSRDLVNWRLLTRPLRRASQLNMLGDPDSCGIWAPALRHYNGRFYLIYTDVKRYGQMAFPPIGVALRDTHNYLVTCDTIDGEWSEPVYVNSSGFDPSLFQDDDGRLYFLNMLWDHRPGQNRFGGIVIQEYSDKEKKLVGKRTTIFTGTAIGFTEGPHIHKRDGWYYLIVAEGGTSFGHAETVARSRNLLGPYEVHPDTYLVSSRDRPDAKLRRAGHGDLVDDQNGDTWFVHLCARPLPNRGRSPLGRETAIQKVVWGMDGWPRLDGNDYTPRTEWPAPKLKAHPFPKAPERSEFDSRELPIDFQWLRSPWPEELFSLAARPGHLRLFGRESIFSFFKQSLVARRLQAHCASLETVVDFNPEHFQQMAGLTCFYNASKFHYLHVTRDEEHGRHLRVLSSYPDLIVAETMSEPIKVPDGPIRMRAEIDEERLLFAWAAGSGPWNWLPQVFDASILSDEATMPGRPNFTGAFVGMACQDVAGAGAYADFDYFLYRERGYRADPR